MESGLVFNIQHYSLHDGPGIRSTVFLKGCPLCCAWCHNPEGMRTKSEIMVLENRCIACGECRDACPMADALAGDGPLPGRIDDCLLCGACSEACPTDARRMAGGAMSVEEVMEAVLKDRIFYEESGGGVTVSGGEPLTQPLFTVALLEACRAGGIHTVLDTTGLGKIEDLLEAAAAADLVFYDLKAFDADIHRKLTGVSNEQILQNLQILDREHCDIWIRMPIIPGLNNDPGDMRKTAEFVSGLRHATHISLLPFHRTGLHKFERLGLSHELHHLQSPSDEVMAAAAGIFEGCGLPVRIGG